MSEVYILVVLYVDLFWGYKYYYLFLIDLLHTLCVRRGTHTTILLLGHLHPPSASTSASSASFLWGFGLAVGIIVNTFNCCCVLCVLLILCYVLLFCLFGMFVCYYCLCCLYVCCVLFCFVFVVCVVCVLCFYVLCFVFLLREFFVKLVSEGGQIFFDLFVLVFVMRFLFLCF